MDFEKDLDELFKKIAQDMESHPRSESSSDEGAAVEGEADVLRSIATSARRVTHLYSELLAAGMPPDLAFGLAHRWFSLYWSTAFHDAINH